MGDLRPWQTRTHCCGHIVADTKVSPFARARNICCGHKFCDFVQKHFVSAANVSQFAQPKKHHGQQCVRNNVSSFTRAFRLRSGMRKELCLCENGNILGCAVIWRKELCANG